MLTADLILSVWVMSSSRLDALPTATAKHGLLASFLGGLHQTPAFRLAVWSGDRSGVLPKGM